MSKSGHKIQRIFNDRPLEPCQTYLVLKPTSSVFLLAVADERKDRCAYWYNPDHNGTARKVRKKENSSTVSIAYHEYAVL